MDIQIKRAETAQELKGARSLRFKVFVEEQGVPRELEIDALDATAVHAIALRDGSVVGTGRLVIDASANGAIIGRMAVTPTQRRRGVGSGILVFLEAEARSRGVGRITLHAQSYVKEFYARHGYQEEGEPFLEVGIPHIQMSKDLG